MTNPWLDIPLTDYVGHMGSPQVGQCQVLNSLFRDALASVRPNGVLVLGCSSGNGLEHIEPRVTSRVVALDMNPEYLERLVQRFPTPPFALEVRCADLALCSFEREAFDLVHAALIFEYVDWRRVLPHVAEAMRQGGVLSVVLQRPSQATPPVTPTPFSMLRSLESIFCFVDSDALVVDAAALGLHLESRSTETLPSSKAFEVLRLRMGTRAA